MAALSFSFQASGLAEQLRQSLNSTHTGYWRIQPAKSNDVQTCYLAVVRGKIIFSGTQHLSWPSLLATLQRYVFQLRSPQARQTIQDLEAELAASDTMQLGKYITRLSEIKLFSQDELLKVLRVKILSDLDNYLHDCSGQVDFTEDLSLLISAPIAGFDLDGLLIDATRRREQWLQLRKYMPSPSTSLTLQPELIVGSKLTDSQKQQLERLVVDGRTLNDIAQHMSKDVLDVAKAFAPMFNEKLIIAKVTETDRAKAKSQPEIFIVDDSPLLVQQFRLLVEKWGYQVNSSSNALTAVDEMTRSHPSAIFLDINMPGASGFDLIKQIRRQSNLASVPVVLLTAEKTLSNQWRAQWANCKFLSKPSNTQEIASFRSDLYALLQEMAPTTEEGTLL